jgi:hypothetical protein
MELAAAQRLYQLLHEKRPYHDGVMVDGHFVNWAEEPSPQFPYHMHDGASIWVSPVDYGLGGDFLERDPGSLAEQAPGEQHEPEPDAPVEHDG